MYGVRLINKFPWSHQSGSNIYEAVKTFFEFTNMFRMKLRPSLVQAIEPARGCDMNTRRILYIQLDNKYIAYN